MKRNHLYTPIFLTLVALLMPAKVTAQKVNSLYFLEKTPFHTQWNPAMAPSRSGIGIGISNISFSFQSDLALNDLVFPSKNGEKPYTFLDPQVDANAFIAGLKDVSSLNINTSIDIFNLGIRILNNYFTLHSGISFDAGIGVPKDFFKLFMLGMDNTNSNTQFDLTGLNANMMSYVKTGVGYSMKLGQIFSVGINANYLEGIADMRMGFDELTIDAGQTKWEVTSKGYIQMAAPDMASFTYNDKDSWNGVDVNTKSLSGGSMPKSGNGFSVDLGVTAKPLPFLTLSAAVLDLGSIKWDAKYIQRAKSNGTYTYEGEALNDEAETSMSSQTLEDLEEMVHFTKDNSAEAYSSKLTTKLNIGAEAGILKNKITFGILSQTGFATEGNYEDLMLSANFKPSSIIQGALSYSLLHGNMSSYGAAMNCKLLFFNIFAAADYIPFKYTPQFVPINNSFYNLQFGINMMF